jgi:uncharacterized protein YbjT (DUF2867 family)
MTGLFGAHRLSLPPSHGANQEAIMDLITGVSGMMGGAVVQEMRKRGRPMKAMYRDAEDAKKAPAGVSTVIADYANKDGLRKAFDGIESLYLVCSPIPQLVELESNAIDVCVEKEVPYVVLNSALGAGDYGKSFPAWHRKVEDKLKSSGLNYTILRPNSFMQNILVFYSPSIRSEGVFYASMGDAEVSVIDARDIAAVIVSLLEAPAMHFGKTYELNGPEALTYAEIGETISRVAGRPVKYVDVPEDAQRKAMEEQQMPQWLVSALLDLQRYYTVEGKGGEVTDVLKRLLQRAPITLDQFLQENRESFRPQAAGA